MKAFRDQIRECKANGNLIEVDISIYALYLTSALICLKHKKACVSRLCFEERNKEDIVDPKGKEG